MAIANPADAPAQRNAADSNGRHVPGQVANVAPAERIASGVAGAALINFAVAKRRDVGGAALAFAGGYLLYRAASGYCPGYAALRTGTTSEPAAERNVDAPTIAHGQSIKVLHSVTVNRPAGELYIFWRNFCNLALVMWHLREVTVQDETHSHWVARAPLGTNVEWDAEIINDVPGERISWRSLPGADVPNAGTVLFEAAPGHHGTVVTVNLQYDPPAGVLGAAITHLFGEEPDQQVAYDLMRFKAMMEEETRRPRTENNLTPS